MKHAVCVIPEYNTCEGTELSVEFRISMQDTNILRRTSPNTSKEHENATISTD